MSIFAIDTAVVVFLEAEVRGGSEPVSTTAPGRSERVCAPRLTLHESADAGGGLDGETVPSFDPTDGADVPGAMVGLFPVLVLAGVFLGEEDMDVSDGEGVPGRSWVVPNFRSPPSPLAGCTPLEAAAPTAAGPLVFCVGNVAVEGSFGDIPPREPVFRTLDLGATPVAAG